MQRHGGKAGDEHDLERGIAFGGPLGQLDTVHARHHDVGQQKIEGEALDAFPGFVAVAEKLAPLAVAVHNAGSNRPAPFLKVSAESFEQHWREHALGGFHLGQAAIPVLLANGGGSLIFSGASGSLRGKANFSPFAGAKAAVRNVAQSIAREYGPQGIHVGHVVIDGGIEGERLLTLRPQLKDERGPDGMLNIDAIAEAYWTLHHQHRSAWTLELDLRPWSETF